MKRVQMYTTGMCPFCVMAKRLLLQKGAAIDEIRVDEDATRREEMMRVTGRRTVPQIFVGETHVGGYDDLSAMNRDGKLDPLLKD
jgi:glutaredoxin 3